MTESIRRMSPSAAAAAVGKIALAYAAAKGIEGRLLGTEPDNLSTEHRGKMPVHWVAVFESVIDGAVFDGPLVLCVNLESGHVSPAA
jgi:hypothetical protein